MVGWVGVARFGGIGDNLICASPLRPLKRLGYNIEMITNDKQGVVYNNNPFIDKLTVVRDGHIPTGPDWNKWFSTRAKEYDQFWHLSHTCEGRHALNVGTAAFWWPAHYRRKICAGSYLETVHDVCGVAYDFGPLYFPTEEERARAERTREENMGGAYLAWIVSGSRIDKLHPYTGMAIARVIRECKIPVVMFGAGEKQVEEAKTIIDHVKRQNGNDKGLFSCFTQANSDPGGAHDWSVRRSLAQVLLADCVVTPDTGFAWAAAMEPMRKVVLISHTSVENITKHWVNTITLHADPYRVPCWPCHRLHDTQETCTPTRDLGNAAACISDISVEQILEAIQTKPLRPMAMAAE